MTNRFDSKVIGLDVGLLIGKFFMDTEELHYGYWPDEKKATAQNFSQAQDRHSQLIIDNIPNNVKKILDVGSGSGSLAKKMVSLGYQVDCVIPSEFLAEKVQQKLDASSKIHITKFEDLNIFKKLSEQYDSQREKVTSSLRELKQLLATESKESSQMLDIYYRYVAGENISKDDLTKANDCLLYTSDAADE